MKKVLMVVAVAGFLVSCDNAADSAARTKDSLDSVTKLQKESVENASDTAQKNLDQMNEAKKDMVDSLNKGADTTNKSH
jgi:cell division protein FtsX